MATTTTTVSSNKDLERSINSLTAGALPYFRNIFRQRKRYAADIFIRNIMLKIFLLVEPNISMMP